MYIGHDWLGEEYVFVVRCFKGFFDGGFWCRRVPHEQRQATSVGNGFCLRFGDVRAMDVVIGLTFRGIGRLTLTGLVVNRTWAS
jgi:hypothetical protein